MLLMDAYGISLPIKWLKLGTGITHLFFAAYQPQPTLAEEVAPNRALLLNAIESLEAAGSSLQHVTLVTGAKYYGVRRDSSPSLHERSSRATLAREIFEQYY